MSLSKSNIKKWTKMLFGKSIAHVKQGVGKVYSFEEIKGYYNDLTLKVLKDHKHYKDTNVFPLIKDKKAYYPAIEIFQYGLALYDLILLKHNPDLMEQKFRNYVEWTINNQNENGSWDAFSFRFKDNIYSSMAQGEGTSLLIRAYIHYGDKKYLLAARKAIDFMLTPISDGGTAIINGRDIFLYEYTHKPLVFNGWIFSIFGLIDYCIVSNNEKYRDILNRTLDSFFNQLPNIDNGYWSMYDCESIIASPFYHRLHIALLYVLHEYTHNEEIKKIELRLKKYNRNIFKKAKAFLKKAKQKIRSKDD